MFNYLSIRYREILSKIFLATFMFVFLYVTVAGFIDSSLHRYLITFCFLFFLFFLFFFGGWGAFDLNVEVKILLCILLITLLIRLTIGFSFGHIKILLGLLLVAILPFAINKRFFFWGVGVTAFFAAFFAYYHNYELGMVRKWPVNVITHSTMTASFFVVSFYFFFKERALVSRLVLFSSMLMFLFAVSEADTRGTALALVLGGVVAIFILRLRDRKNSFLPVLFLILTIFLLISNEGLSKRIKGTVSHIDRGGQEDVNIVRGFIVEGYYFRKASNEAEIKFPDYGLDFSANYRLTLWILTVDVIAENFPYGVGSSLSDIVYERLERYKPSYAKSLKPIHVHNQFLQSVAKYGLFGLIILVLVFLSPIYLLYKGRSGAPFIFVAMSTVGVCALTDVPLYNGQTAALIYFLFMLSAKVDWDNEEGDALLSFKVA